MPFTQPTRAEILERIKADFRIEMGVDPLRRSVEYALSRALTGQSKGLYGYLRFIFAQCFPDTAESFYFWRWAQIFGITQKAATRWAGFVEFTGTDGTFIGALQFLTRSDGTEYFTTASGTIAAGVLELPAQSDPPGTAADLEPGTPLTLEVPIAGVDNAAAAGSTTLGGTDIETPAEGLVRVLQRLQTPPSGGGPGDYVRWALEVPGVTRAWEFVPVTPNEVDVAAVRDDDGVGAAILPDSTERAAIQAHVQSRAPITTTVVVLTLTALTVNVQISALVPDDPSVRAAVTTSLQDFFSREASPGTTIAISRLDAAISESAGEISHVLDLPTTAIVAGRTEVPVLGTVVFV